MTKRVLSCLMALSLLLCSAPALAVDGGVETSATGAILVDVTTGQVLYQKNPDKQLLIASTTKIMTALVAIRYGNLSDVVTVSSKAAGTEGSSMYLKAGETLTLQTLLYGLLMRSGNDAAVAIAEHVGGSVEAFAAMMNATARELGMTNSSFANPHGLNQTGHYSTARDMATLAKAAMENETLQRITSTKSITIGGRTMANQNKLLNLVEGCIGLKTGYTKAAGRTLVSCVERDGHRLVAVTLHDSNDWVDHQNLYKYGFDLIAEQEKPVLVERKVLDAGDYCGEAPVIDGEFPSVPLMAASALTCMLQEDDLLEVRTELTGSLAAPVFVGDRAGVAVYSVNGEEVGRVDLLCSASISPKAATAVLRKVA